MSPASPQAQSTRDSRSARCVSFVLGSFLPTFEGENRVACKDALGVLEVEENFCRAQIAAARSSSFLKGHGFKPCRHARKGIAALAAEGLLRLRSHSASTRPPSICQRGDCAASVPRERSPDR